MTCNEHFAVIPLFFYVELQLEKSSGLKLVLKVGPLTPSDVTADSQSETQDSDTAMSEKKFKLRKRAMQNDRNEILDKKVINILLSMLFLNKFHVLLTMLRGH